MPSRRTRDNIFQKHFGDKRKREWFTDEFWAHLKAFFWEVERIEGNGVEEKKDARNRLSSPSTNLCHSWKLATSGVRGDQLIKILGE